MHRLSEPQIEPPEETYWEHEMRDDPEFLGPDGPIPDAIIDRDPGDEDA